MKNPTAEIRPWQAAVLRLAILIPVALLVYYHLTMIHDGLVDRGVSTNEVYNAIQLALRLAIAGSLICVALGVRVALWTMWASIGGLVATQYWAHFGLVQAEFTAERHVLSYLKGFILPSIITAAFLLRERREA